MLEPSKTYKLPIRNGYLDIMVSNDPNYPGLDIEYVSHKDHMSTNPRVLIENPQPDGEMQNLRVLIWNDPASEDYTEKIEFPMADKPITNA